MPYDYALPARINPNIGSEFPKDERVFTCQICGKPGETTSRVQKTHHGDCSREAQRRRREKFAAGKAVAK
jgi:hypothetical protein